MASVLVRGTNHSLSCHAPGLLLQLFYIFYGSFKYHYVSMKMAHSFTHVWGRMTSFVLAAFTGVKRPCFLCLFSPGPPPVGLVRLLLLTFYTLLHQSYCFRVSNLEQLSPNICLFDQKGKHFFQLHDQCRH